MITTARALGPILVVVAFSPLPLLGQSAGSPANPAAPGCAAPEARNAKSFDETQPELLIGRYELVMVSQWEDEKGRWSKGVLEIWRTDEGAIQGASDIDLSSMDVPGHSRNDAGSPGFGPDLDSRDTLRPGLAYQPPGRTFGGSFLLSPVVQADGFWSWLEVDSLSDGGFWGRWDSDLGLAKLVKKGRILPNPHGIFCATRVHGALEDRKAPGAMREEARGGPPSSSTSRKNELIGAGFGIVFGGLLGQGLACRYAETDCGLQIESVAVGALIGGTIGAGLGSAWDE